MYLAVAKLIADTGGISVERRQVQKGKPLELPPRMKQKKTFLLLPAVEIEPTTSWLGASLLIQVHHPRPLSDQVKHNKLIKWNNRWTKVNEG